MSIDHINLRKIDLNLLLAFDALMESRSVSAAAATLNIGQPAMSHALRRLREHFGDPIFVRATGGLTPTEKALALWKPVRRALEDLQDGLKDAEKFDPKRESRTFTISISDYLAALLVPKLVQHARKQAPGIGYRIESLGRADGLAALSENRIDVFIGVAETPVWAISERLFADDFVTLYDPAIWNHPPTGLDSFCNAPHALASLVPSFSGWVDNALETLNRKRHVVFSAARFADAAICVKGSELLLTLPTTAAKQYAENLKLAIMSPPVEPRGLEIKLFRRGRSEGAADSEWLAATIRTLSAETFL